MVHPSSVIYPCVVLGNNVYIGPNCIIGAPPEHKQYWNGSEYQDTGKQVIINDGTVIHGNVTIDQGTIHNTVIGRNCFIMKGAHIGHDALLENDVTLSPHAIIGGHCEIGEGVNFGMGSIIHQRAKVPKGCMIGMGAVITKKTDMWENGVFVGNPAYFLRANNR